MRLKTKKPMDVFLASSWPDLKQLEDLAAQ
jgi:hypothetical protein